MLWKYLYTYSSSVFYHAIVKLACDLMNTTVCDFAWHDKSTANDRIVET